MTFGLVCLGVHDGLMTKALEAATHLVRTARNEALVSLRTGVTPVHMKRR